MKNKNIKYGVKLQEIAVSSSIREFNSSLVNSNTKEEDLRMVE